MPGPADWREAAYREALEGELRRLRRRREHDPSLTAADIEGTLTHLYIMDGADAGGRGEVQDVGLKAVIAAHEAFAAEWKAERDTPGEPGGPL